MTKAKESKELTSWQQDLKAHAKEIAHNEGSDSPAVVIQHGAMMYHDQPVPNNELDVIVVASTTERCYYDKPYDPDVISSPACFAQGLEPRNLTPHPNVVAPQSAKCDGCAMAEFGSAKVGKGPACKTYRKIIMIPASTLAYEVAQAEMAYMKVSPTSVKNWSKYAQQLASSAGIPPWAAKTQVKVVPDKKTIHQIQFNGIAPIEDQDMLAAIHSRIEDAESKLMQPYTYEEEEEASNY